MSASASTVSSHTPSRPSSSGWTRLMATPRALAVRPITVRSGAPELRARASPAARAR